VYGEISDEHSGTTPDAKINGLFAYVFWELRQRTFTGKSDYSCFHGLSFLENIKPDVTYQ
jgi:hypothetical protein